MHRHFKFRRNFLGSINNLKERKYLIILTYDVQFVINPL